MKIRIKILRRHIKGADTSDIYDCPIARAMKEAGYTNVVVGGATIDFDEYKDVFLLAGLDEKGCFLSNPKPFTLKLDTENRRGS